MQEDELIPYAAAEIPAERVLTISAHPDDDVFGAGALLARLAASAESVRAIVLTGGEAQEATGAGSADPEVRRREAAEAAADLGIAEVRFWDFPDRGLEGVRASLVARLRDEIVEFRPDLIVAPSPCEIHPDHRVAAEAVYAIVSESRAGDPHHETLRWARILFYEITQPILPNALVPLGDFAEAKRAALGRFASQAAVRDYASAVAGLNAFRGLTLGGAPAESFRLVTPAEASVQSLARLRREIGPAAISPGARSVAPVAVVVRTRNRPALVVEALESLSAQTSRPRRVVVVNDGGGPVVPLLERFASDYELVFVEHPVAAGRSAAANAGIARVTDGTALGFLDDDDVLEADHFERLLAARSAGPEPIVYSDAVTVVLEPAGGGWRERHRELQYSLDYDGEYLLFANYIPLHTVLFDAPLVRRVGAFDAALDYSEDWDLLIRLSFETPFRHVRGVTAAYRIFPGEGGHVEAGGGAFAAARRRILERYRDRRDDAMAVRVLDRVSRGLWETGGREYRAEGELRFHRASHRRLSAERDALNGEARALAGDKARLEQEIRSGQEGWERRDAALQGQIARLSAIIEAMQGTKAWRLHLRVQKLKGKA